MYSEKSKQNWNKKLDVFLKKAKQEFQKPDEEFHTGVLQFTFSILNSGVEEINQKVKKIIYNTAPHVRSDDVTVASSRSVLRAAQPLCASAV